MDKPRIFITKSRAGHYTITAKLNGISQQSGYHATAWHAKLARAEVETELLRTLARLRASEAARNV